MAPSPPPLAEADAGSSSVTPDCGAADFDWIDVKQRMHIHPVSVRFDYIPNGTSTYQALSEAAEGDLAQLVPTFREVALEFSRLRLGVVTDLDELLAAVMAEWLPQLKYQLHKLLTGLPPVRSLRRVTDGLAALLLAPVRPAPLRGIQHGGTQLLKSVAQESLELTVRLLGGTQALFEQIDVLLAAVPTTGQPDLITYSQTAAQVSANTLAAASEVAAYLRDAMGSSGP